MGAYTMLASISLCLFISLDMVESGGYAPILYIRILALAPLSGVHNRSGHAQLAGVKLGMQEDLHRLNALPNTNIVFEYNDTQCEPAKEDDVVWRAVMSSPSPVIVLGGGCVQGSQHTDSSLKPTAGYISTIVPRASFDEGPVASTNHVNVRDSLFSGHGDIVSYITSHGWSSVAMVHSNLHLHQMGCSILAKELSHTGVNASLVLKYSTTNIHQVIQGSGLRAVIAYTGDEDAAKLICSIPPDQRGRYAWIAVTRERTTFMHYMSSICAEKLIPPVASIVTFEVKRNPLLINDFQIFKHLVTTDKLFHDNDYLRREAAFAYEATKLVLDNLLLLLTSSNLRELDDREELASRLIRSTINSRRDGVTGTVQFQTNGLRKVTSEISEMGELNMGTDTVTPVKELDGIPLSLFVIVCALSLLGVVYSIAILVFNIAKQKDKIIKMTSPNINVIVLLGAVFGYASLVLMGLDSKRVSIETMGKLLQAGSFILMLSFTFIFGATFTKSWRVYMIFKNVNANGKLTRDEHLVLGILGLLLLDLAILLPWTIVDPIQCTRIEMNTRYQASTNRDVTVVVDECASSLQGVWVGVSYAYKAVILALGAFFTWQTRHVTLPALQDSREVYMAIYTVVAMGLVSVPVLLIANIGMTVRYATGSVAVWLAITTTLTLLFVPKIRLYLKAAKDGQKDMKFQFKESMEKTREAVGKCVLFCCGEKEEDKYAQEVLHSEIETMKRTIKEKDATIRELTDRLYIGTEKFQEYLVSPKKNSALEAMRRKHGRRAQSAYTNAPSRYQPESRRAPRHLSLDHDQKRYRESMGGSADPDTGTFPLDSMSEGEEATGLDRRRHRHNSHGSYSSHGRQDIAVIHVDDGPHPAERGGYTHARPQHVTDLPSPLYPRPVHGHARGHTQQPQSPSPNHDSAIDNNSPSSDTGSSERGEYNHGFPAVAAPSDRDSFRRRADVYAAPIDLEAMESDATTNGCWPEPGDAGGAVQQRHHSVMRTPSRPVMNRIELQPYRTAMINGVSVSQI